MNTINRKQLCKLRGIKPGSLSKAISRGTIPEPDRDKGKPRATWLAKTLIDAGTLLPEEVASLDPSANRHNLEAIAGVHPDTEPGCTQPA